MRMQSANARIWQILRANKQIARKIADGRGTYGVKETLEKKDKDIIKD